MMAVISFSILFNVLRYVNTRVVRKPGGSPKAVYAYLNVHEEYRIVYNTLYYIVIYVLPVVILAVLTYRLYSDL